VGVLAGTSTAAGVVPTDATAGMPPIESFNGEPGFIHSLTLDGGATTAAAPGVRVALFDLLFKAGAYAFNAAVTLAAQPSYSSRVPGGTDFDGTQIWVEGVTAFTGIPTFTITYTNSAGTAARTTTFTPLAVMTIGELQQIPLQAGDNGVQKIETVTCTISTVGTFNVLVMRPLMIGGEQVSTYTSRYGEAEIELPQIWDTSALYPLFSSSATLNTTNPDLLIGIAHGTPGVGDANTFTVDMDMPGQRQTTVVSTTGYSKAQVVN
jgi:hypothetical protein